MREMRSISTLAGTLSLALLLIAAAVGSAEPLPQRVPIAMTRPVALATAPAAATRPSISLPESGLLALVGTALIGLASVVRRTTWLTR